MRPFSNGSQVNRVTRFDEKVFLTILIFLFTGQVPIVLTLPPNISVSELKWISVWCRQFSINFGDFVFDEQPEDPQPFETTTEQIGMKKNNIILTFSKSALDITKNAWLYLIVVEDPYASEASYQNNSKCLWN